MHAPWQQLPSHPQPSGGKSPRFAGFAPETGLGVPSRLIQLGRGLVAGSHSGQKKENVEVRDAGLG